MLPFVLAAVHGAKTYSVHCDTKRDYAESVKFCETVAGRSIASFQSDADVAMAKVPEDCNAYIGGEKVDGKWTWRDGTKWWLNGKNDGMKSGETRVAVNSRGEWHDWQHGEAKLGVICQQPKDDADIYDWSKWTTNFNHGASSHGQFRGWCEQSCIGYMEYTFKGAGQLSLEVENAWSNPIPDNLVTVMLDGVVLKTLSKLEKRVFEIKFAANQKLRIQEDFSIVEARIVSLQTEHKTVMEHVDVVKSMINAVAKSHAGMDDSVKQVSKHAKALADVRKTAIAELTAIRDKLTTMKAKLNDKKTKLGKEDASIVAALAELKARWTKLNSQQAEKLKSAEEKRAAHEKKIKTMLVDLERRRRLKMQDAN